MLVDSIRAFESPVRIERDVCRTMSEALSNDLWMFSGLEREGGPRVAQIVEAQPEEWCRRVQPVIGGLLSFELPREPLRVETTAIQAQAPNCVGAQPPSAQYRHLPPKCLLPTFVGWLSLYVRASGGGSLAMPTYRVPAPRPDKARQRALGRQSE